MKIRSVYYAAHSNHYWIVTAFGATVATDQSMVAGIWRAAMIWAKRRKRVTV